MIKNKNIPLIIAFVISLISYLFIFFVPLGIADGGAMYKVLEKLGLMYASSPSGEYFSPFYVFKNGVPFDIRILSLVYYVLFVGGLLTLVRAISKRSELNLSILFSFAASLVLCDFCYLLYFNTFYREAAVFVLVILAVGAGAVVVKRENVHKWCAAQFVLAVSFLAIFGLDAALVAIVLGIAFSVISSGCYKGKFLGIIAGIVPIVFAIISFVVATSVNYNRDLYSSVFLGVCQTDSVEAIGLDPALDELKGTFYSEETEEKYNLTEELYNKISYADIAEFYLTNPKALISALSVSAANGFNVRPSYLGNFPSGHSGQQANYFAFYSMFKSKFVPNNLLSVFLMFVIYFGVLIYIYKNESEKRKITFSMIMLGVAAVCAFLTPYLISGIYELGRTMFLFNVLFDLMLISSVTAGTRYMLERRKKIREKFGTTQ